jgi:hypothetical protein
MKTTICSAAWSVTTAAFLLATAAPAATNVFFTGSQTATVATSNINAVTIQSGAYRFTYSVDGYFTGGVGLTNPVGRFFSVFWPNGIQAQAITTGPLVGKGATVTIRRTDGGLFGLRSFTGKLLANTAATGADFELMPQLDGEDALNDPLMFNASGYHGSLFPHTPALSGYDAYKVNLFVDFALTALTLVDSDPAAPPGTPTNTITATASPAGAGTITGAGSFPDNSSCTLTATANPGWAFKEWTQNGALVTASPVHNFTVRSNRALVAVFIANAPPVAAGGSFFQLTNTPLAINIADLISNDHDPDGDPVSFAGVSATTSNGLTLTVTATQILVPPNSLPDAFTCTIADSHGATATGRATISIVTNVAAIAAALERAPDGATTIRFTGVPWHFYECQRATNCTFTGAIHSRFVQAGAGGQIEVHDDYTDLGQSPAASFYRLIHR